MIYTLHLESQLGPGHLRDRCTPVGYPVIHSFKLIKVNIPIVQVGWGKLAPLRDETYTLDKDKILDGEIFPTPKIPREPLKFGQWALVPENQKNLRAELSSHAHANAIAKPPTRRNATII